MPPAQFAYFCVSQDTLAMSTQRFLHDLGLLAETFQLQIIPESDHLTEWLSAHFELDTVEQALFESVYADARIDAGYWNEEELKIQMVGMLFRIANINEPDRIKVFYERPLSATVDGHALAVITDCLVATPLPFSTPRKPYFFLQDGPSSRFKKKRGEKRDRNVGPPEAQMLTAMLIAREQNQDNYPLYGGYLIGSIWNFSVLDGKKYSSSRQYDATNRDDLMQIIYVLWMLKTLVLSR